MTEDHKKQLMQSVYKLAEHYQIPNATLVPFKKRSVLLELLQTKNEKAFELVSDVLEISMRLDRIENDKEKQAKKLDHWTEEVASVTTEKNTAIETLLEFFKKEGINSEGINF